MVSYYTNNIQIDQKECGCKFKRIIGNSGSTLTVKTRMLKYCDKHKEQ